MPKEIEHKFLVDPEKIKDLISQLPKNYGMHLTQGYLSRNPTVRVRVKTNGFRWGWVTIKGKGKKIRDEWEWHVSYEWAKDMLKLCGKRKLKKIRYEIGPWEIDQFLGKNKGLWLAEYEVSKSGKLPKKLPSWIIREVTNDPQYSNSNLANE